MLLVIKLFATPILIGLSLIATRVWGPLVGSAIAGLPFISGPGSVFLCLDNGKAFAASAAHASLLGLISSCLYCVAYAYLCRYMSCFAALPLALGIFGFTAIIMRELPDIYTLWIIVSFLTPLVSIYVLPKIKQVKNLPASPAWKIPVQMVCGGLAVLLVTGAANIFGTYWSGVLLTFPIVGSIIIPFSHYSYGSDITVQTIKGLLIGMSGSAVFNIFVSLFLVSMNSILCYGLAFCASIITSLVCVLLGIGGKK